MADGAVASLEHAQTEVECVEAMYPGASLTEAPHLSTLTHGTTR